MVEERAGPGLRALMGRCGKNFVFPRLGADGCSNAIPSSKGIDECSEADVACASCEEGGIIWHLVEESGSLC